MRRRRSRRRRRRRRRRLPPAACRLPRRSPRCSAAGRGAQQPSPSTRRAPLPLQQAGVQSKEGEVLAALATIIDPDFGMNIVDCGFIKDLVRCWRGWLV